MSGRVKRLNTSLYGGGVSEYYVLQSTGYTDADNKVMIIRELSQSFIEYTGMGTSRSFEDVAAHYGIDTYDIDAWLRLQSAIEAARAYQDEQDALLEASKKGNGLVSGATAGIRAGTTTQRTGSHYSGKRIDMIK